MAGGRTDKECNTRKQLWRIVDAALWSPPPASLPGLHAPHRLPECTAAKHVRKVAGTKRSASHSSLTCEGSMAANLLVQAPE
mmetsp:Transcript_96888/g.156308  ORF Transcript_96888/g.156308 Transcript_96888/m.156308 type:complete len:82 (-) Transcript_96888:47-292(-)